MGQLQSYGTLLEEQCEIEVQRGGLTLNLLNNASETYSNLLQNILEVRAHYDLELADLQYERHGSTPGLRI